MIEFFFDCSSPWTYLAFHNIQPLAKEFGAEISWRPILVGGIFNSVNPSVYASRETPVPLKARYQKKDLADWARSAGLAIKMPPTVFPVNSVKAMRGCIWLRQGHGAVRPRGIRGLLGRRQGHFEGRGADRDLRERRRRPAKVLRRHRRSGDQGPAQGQYRRGDGARRLRLADHLRRQDRHVFRQRPDAADPRGAGAAARRGRPDAEERSSAASSAPPESLRLETYRLGAAGAGRRCASPCMPPASIFPTS